MTALSVVLILAGNGSERVVGWVGVAFFGVGGAAALVIRGLRPRHAPAAPAMDAPIEIDADVEIARTAEASGLPEEVAGRVIEARYDYLEGHPRDQPVEDHAERVWVARRTGVDEDTVRRVLRAHDEFLMRAGVMTPAP